jgi:hypothetical protein
MLVSVVERVERRYPILRQFDISGTVEPSPTIGNGNSESSTSTARSATKRSNGGYPS